MSTLQIILAIFQLLSGLAVTVIVLMQSGKSAGLSGAISGGADNFLSKGKAKTWDAKLAKLTPIFALVFVVLTFVLNLLPPLPWQPQVCSLLLLLSRFSHACLCATP